MYKKILLALVFILTTSFTPNPTPKLRDSVTIKNEIYEIKYSEVLESPLVVKYKISCTNGTASRVGLTFYTVPNVHTADDADYIHNTYDKGHMAPAADFNCTPEMLYLTFSYVNCALQDQALNRITWRFLEAKEREYAQTNTVNVEIRVDVDKKCVKLESGAYVPKGFYKTIYIKETKQVLKYYMPNSKPTYADPEKYRIN
jgi:endonuclease G, mitochondrial